ncbi:hypothetical protein GMOD_00009527 [Pyrenophora seminiperda CCB06]|uniref:Uncharacterized protein n=1 Tax=Pyrenophora seminiperda CCB06 TaxID=1302712 RepID=A0A3M7MF01_9PLEO|nr:hypothetical protein GMOD_00009527 [Pyrenophora seminiperda CCB06]
MEATSVSDARKKSKATNDYLRKVVASWEEYMNAPTSYTPPGCRAISYSSWVGFTTSPSLENRSLKASDLCKDYGTTANYCPPVGERCYLGVGRPAVPIQNEEHVPRARQPCRQQPISMASTETVSSFGEDEALAEPTMQFKKQTPKRADTTSLLTMCLNKGTVKEAKKTFAEMMGICGMTCDDLPSAFDSNEDED